MPNANHFTQIIIFTFLQQLTLSSSRYFLQKMVMCVKCKPQNPIILIFADADISAARHKFIKKWPKAADCMVCKKGRGWPIV
jgi:hypothetical protein